MASETVATKPYLCNKINQGLNFARSMKESWLLRRYKQVFPETVWHFVRRDWKKHHEDVHRAQMPELYRLFIDGWIPKKKWQKKNRDQLGELWGSLTRKLNNEMTQRRRMMEYRRSPRKTKKSENNAH
ncbi:uncharacterized protein LOC123317446 isoform X2 [Coccinella septempunctata]|uniref:uncharacterized protein LOC123317446 isoform X2 n=1 Tax=Coccinella septempunctata TaxID=41139 RepID=UPI001D061B9E|nr:uncharacterized protein LOC123317446 isoform X2 [Coccinella septempunctata]